MKTKLSITEIKNIELSILIEFDKYCLNNDLTYFLCGGTLLGCIRHKGFIPWDDDIDVFMPRSDYEKFYELTLNNPIKENLLTSTYRKCKNIIPYPFMKIIDTKTEVIEQGKNTKRNNGIWIDILPLDVLPKDDRTNEIVYSRMRVLRKKLFFALTDITLDNSKNIFTFFYKKFKQVIAKKNIFSICKRMDVKAQAFRNLDTGFVGCLLWGLYGNGERCDKNVFNIAKGSFEGEEFNIPSGWDVYLKGIYGNYMELPPIEKRTSHSIVAYKII
jgi:lipopolysaccharide cholinephosphotransferase